MARQIVATAGAGGEITIGDPLALAVPTVELWNDGHDPVPRMDVTVAIPAGAGIQFPTTPLFAMCDDDGNRAEYIGQVSDDGQSVTFADVDVCLPAYGAHAVAAVWVRERPNAAEGRATVRFDVGGHTVESGPVTIVAPPEPEEPRPVTMNKEQATALREWARAKGHRPRPQDV